MIENKGLKAIDSTRRAAVPLAVTPTWAHAMPLQQQSVLLLAARGPDGVAKYHACKRVVRAYRGTVLVAAKYGRCLRVGERADNFMDMSEIADAAAWYDACDAFFHGVDELPHHYYLHLAHGAEVLGYKHPDALLRERWRYLYERSCHDMHVTPETETAMDARLSDWGRCHWGEPMSETKELSTAAVATLPTGVVRAA